VKLALVAFAATVTEAGTVTEASLLERLTVNPLLGAAPLSVTVQVSVPAPVIDPLEHVSSVNVGGGTAPVPLKLMSEEEPVEELLSIVIWPVSGPAVVGSNWIVMEAVWPGFNVVGNAAPEREKPAPLSVTELTVRAAVPVDFRVTVWDDALLRVTLPKPMLVALKVRVGSTPVSSNENVSDMVAAVAVNVAV
jgi:hypothetical protein